MSMTQKELDKIIFLGLDNQIPKTIKKKMPDGRYIYKEWVGVGWMVVDPCDNATEIVD